MRDLGVGSDPAGRLRNRKEKEGERNGHYTNVTTFFIQLFKFLKQGNKSDSMAQSPFNKNNEINKQTYCPPKST